MNLMNSVKSGKCRLLSSDVNTWEVNRYWLFVNGEIIFTYD